MRMRKIGVDHNKGGMGLVASRRALHYVDVHRPRKMLPTPPSPLPSHHSVPSVLATVAPSVPPCVPALSEPAPTVALAAPAPAHAPSLLAPCVSTSHAPCAGALP